MLGRSLIFFDLGLSGKLGNLDVLSGEPCSGVCVEAFSWLGTAFLESLKCEPRQERGLRTGLAGTSWWVGVQMEKAGDCIGTAF